MAEALSSAALDALGDSTRRAIVELLAVGPASVQSIADRLPISRPAVSRHLRLLKQAALVIDEPVGAQRVYRLRADGMNAIRAYFEGLWGEAATRFRLAVENLDESSSR
ncbi:MAG: transcriptional regulator, ArsR family [Actinomycetia bacterium]|nr:transcriptional regulator, ArsR family [Actinomycetes bacterium]